MVEREIVGDGSIVAPGKKKKFGHPRHEFLFVCLPCVLIGCGGRKQGGGESGERGRRRKTRSRDKGGKIILQIDRTAEKPGVFSFFFSAAKEFFFSHPNPGIFCSSQEEKTLSFFFFSFSFFFYILIAVVDSLDHGALLPSDCRKAERN